MAENKRNLIAFGAIAAVVVGWIAFNQATQPSAAEVEADVHQQMTTSGRSPDEICAHAKVVEDAFAREGNDAETKHWALTRELQCINADACRRIEGGCPPANVPL